MSSRADFLCGVNLGGWLVLEKWMTPSLFAGTDAVDEYTLASTADGPALIERHHREFIQEKDFAWLASHGVNAVRIPVGYWIFEGDGPYIRGVEHLDHAMEWAEKYRIKVLIDLHGAPGSQNGLNHSGRIGPVNWRTEDNPARTFATLKQLARRYRDSPALWGIEIVNEPSRGRIGWRLVRFYRRAYKILCEVARPGTHIVFADAYAPLLLTGALWRHRDFPVVMDSHFYQIFNRPDKKRSIDDHIMRAKNRSRLIRWLSLWQPVIIGEWSGSLPIRATDEQIRAYIEAQQAGFRSSLGWFYWSYKLEGSGAWNFRALVEKGVITPGEK